MDEPQLNAGDKKKGASSPFARFLRALTEGLKPTTTDTPATESAAQKKAAGVSRRSFLQTTGTAAALTAVAGVTGLSSAAPSFAAAGAAASGGFTIGLWKGVGSQYAKFTLPETAFWIGEVAYTSGVTARTAHDINQIAFMRQSLKRCPQKQVELLLQHPQETVEWFIKNVTGGSEELAILAKRGMTNVASLYKMSDAEFADYLDNLRRELKESGTVDVEEYRYDPLALAVDFCNIKVGWKPETKCLTLLRPELNQLFCEHRLDWNGHHITTTEGMSTAEKMVARDELMDELKNLVAKQYPNTEFLRASSSGIVIKNPSPEMLKSLMPFIEQGKSASL